MYEQYPNELRRLRRNIFLAIFITFMCGVGVGLLLAGLLIGAGGR